MISMSAIRVKPIAPYVSNNVKKYSPAPVVNIKPTTKQNVHATAKNIAS